MTEMRCHRTSRKTLVFRRPINQRINQFFATLYPFGAIFKKSLLTEHCWHWSSECYAAIAAARRRKATKGRGDFRHPLSHAPVPKAFRNAQQSRDVGCWR